MLRAEAQHVIGRSNAVLGACALLLLAGTARAEPERGSDVTVSAGVLLHHTTPVDLAAIAGATGYGRGNDASPGMLGFDTRAAVLLPVPLELGVDAFIGVGGLNLSRVEQRYFASQPEPIGSSLSVGAGGSVRFAPLVAPGVRVLVGPAVDFERMSASSPAGAAHLDLVGVGLDVGVRLRLNRINRRMSGHLELGASARRELPMALWVGRSRSDVSFTGTAGGGDAIYRFGGSVSYVFSFDDLL